MSLILNFTRFSPEGELEEEDDETEKREFDGLNEGESQG